MSETERAADTGDIAEFAALLGRSSPQMTSFTLLFS